MSLPRLKLIDYNPNSSEFTFEVPSATQLIESLRFMFQFDAVFVVQYGKEKDSVTIKPNKKVGNTFFELFLKHLKPKAVECYGNNDWINFVKQLQKKVGIAGIALLDLNPDCLTVINELLDVQSLVSFQTAVFSAAAKDQKGQEKKDDKTKLDLISIRESFEAIWKQRAEAHYPSRHGYKENLSQSAIKPLPEPLDYKARYLASAETPRTRRILNCTMEGNITHPVMESITFEDMNISFLRSNGYLYLPSIARQYGQSQLLGHWWTTRVAPFYKLNEHAFDLTKTDGYDWNVLTHAIYFGQTDVSRPLLASGRERLRELQGLTLQAAVWIDDNDSLMRCLEAGLPVDECGSTQTTALLAASRKGNLQMISTLLEHKANPNLRNAFKTTALSLAAWSNASSDVLLKLLEAKADCSLAVQNDDITALHWSVEHENFENLDILLKQLEQKKLEVKSTHLLIAEKTGGNTPFHLALVQQKEPSACRILQTASLDVNVLGQMLQHSNEQKQSTLELAAAFPTLSMLKTILTIADRYQIFFSNPKVEVIEAILVKAKNNRAILKLLDKIIIESPLKAKISQLRKAAQDAYCGNILKFMGANEESDLFKENSEVDKAAWKVPKQGRWCM